MLFALLALTLSQTPAPDPIEAPPPVVELETPPAVEAPAVEAPPPVETPLRPEEIPPDPTPPAPDPLPEAAGLGDLPTGLLQAGVGTGVAGLFQATSVVLGLVAATVPFVGAAFSCVNCLIVPGAVAVLETSIGDAVGKRRAASIWPVLATYGGCCVLFTVEVAAVTVLLGSSFSTALNSPNPEAAIAEAVTQPAFQVANIVFLVLQPLVVGVTPALTYAVFSEDKKPGDPGGFGMPGFMSPNHEGPLSNKPSTSGTSVMRF